MKETFRKLAVPVALAASLAGCSTLKAGTKPEVSCPADSSVIQGACLSTKWGVMDALEWRCADRGGEIKVAKVANAPTWVCDVGDGEVFW